MYKKLFGLTKKLIPRISDTELIALGGYILRPRNIYGESKVSKISNE